MWPDEYKIMILWPTESKVCPPQLVSIILSKMSYNLFLRHKEGVPKNERVLTFSLFIFELLSSLDLMDLRAY